MLWNWSVGANHDVIALVAGVTLIPLLIALAWLVVVAIARFLAHVAQRSRATGSGARGRLPPIGMPAPVGAPAGPAWGSPPRAPPPHAQLPRQAPNRPPPPSPTTHSAIPPPPQQPPPRLRSSPREAPLDRAHRSAPDSPVWRSAVTSTHATAPARSTTRTPASCPKPTPRCPSAGPNASVAAVRLHQEPRPLLPGSRQPAPAVQESVGRGRQLATRVSPGALRRPDLPAHRQRGAHRDRQVGRPGPLEPRPRRPLRLLTCGGGQHGVYDGARPRPRI